VIIKRLARGVLRNDVKKVRGWHGMPSNGTKNNWKKDNEKGGKWRGGKNDATWGIALRNVER